MNDIEMAWRTHERIADLVPESWPAGMENGTTHWGTPILRTRCPVHGSDKPDSDGLHIEVSQKRPDMLRFWCPKCCGTPMKDAEFLNSIFETGVALEASLPTGDLSPAGDRLRQPRRGVSRLGKRSSRSRDEPLPEEQELAWCVEDLHAADNGQRLRYLLDERLWSVEQIDTLGIGWADWRKRYAVPVRDGDGDLLNVRWWDPHRDDHDYRWINTRGHGRGKPLWPVPILESLRPGSRVLLCAGEPDCVAALSQGWNAVTSPYGETTPLNNAQAASLADLHVVVVYDSDVAGRHGAAAQVEKLAGFAASARAVDLFPDRNDGSDLTVWLRMQKARPGRMPQAALSVLIRQEETPNGNPTSSPAAQRGNSRHAPTVRGARSSARKGRNAS